MEVHLKAYANALEARIVTGQWIRRYNDSQPCQALAYRLRWRRGRPGGPCGFVTILPRRPQLHRANNRETRSIYNTGFRSSPDVVE
jgi:ATP-dependent helicase YprA (DUF1998 family)